MERRRRPGERRAVAKLSMKGRIALLAAQVIVLRAKREREVEVSHVVVHGAAAGKTTRQRSAVALELSRAAFRPGVLVAADDDGVTVLPEVDNQRILRHRIR